MGNEHRGENQYMVFVPGSTDPPKGPLGADAIKIALSAGSIPSTAKLSKLGSTSWFAATDLIEPPPLVRADPGSLYEVTIDGESIVGPVTREQLVRGVEVGKVPRDARARRSGETTWIPVATILMAAPPATAAELLPPSNVAAGGPRSDAEPGRSRSVRKTALLIGAPLALAALLVAAVVADDKAKPSFDKCLQLDAAGDVHGAHDACSAAVNAAPSGKAGQAAAQKLAEMQPRFDAWQKAEAERQAAERARAQAEAAARAKAEAEARAARAKQLRAKISKKYFDTQPDGVCTGKGLPPYRWSYEGGSFAEDRELALADGCQSPWTYPEATDFCCPQVPRIWGF